MVRLALLLTALGLALSGGFLMASHSPTNDHCDAPGHNPEDPDSGHEEHGDGLGLGHCTTAAVTIEKATNGHDADTAPGPEIRVGHTVTWTYVVTNVGDTDLTNVAVTDDQGVAVKCPATTLAAGASMKCSASAAAVADQYANVGTVTTAEGVTDSDPSHYVGVPPLDIEKRTNGVDADLPPGPTITVGDSVRWTYTVTNNSAVTVTGIAVTDDHEGKIGCPATSLAPHQSMTCGHDGVAGSVPYANLATVTAANADGDTDPSHYTPAGLDIEKFTNGHDADAGPGPTIPVGDPVHWTYTVTNNSAVEVTGIVVMDSREGQIDCPTSLAPHQSMQCKHDGVATAGPYDNLATVTADNALGDTDASHYTGAGLDIEKFTNGHDADAAPGPTIPVGDPVRWTYTVTNNSALDVTGIVVMDSREGAIGCPATSLAPRQSMTCKHDGVATAGPYDNLATVTADNALGDTDPSHYTGAGLDIEKFTNGHDADTAPGPTIPVGDPVRWTYTVTNNSAVDVTGIVVMDSREGAIGCPATSLAPRQSMTCKHDGVAAAGPYDNLATVTADDALGDTDPSHYTGADLDIEKHTNGVDADLGSGPEIPAGQPVTWTYIVTNLRAATVTGITVTDSDETLVVNCPKTALIPGEFMICTAVGVAGEGSYSNTGTVTADNATGDSDDSHYSNTTPVPPVLLRIEKHTNGVDADDPPGPSIEVGQEITWTYKVTNTGDTLANGISVTDSDKSIDIDCDGKTSLPAGASMTCTATGVAEAGQYANTGTVKANGVTHDRDRSHYFGASPNVVASIEATLHGASSPGSGLIRRGDTFDRIKVTVENTGEVEIHNPELDVGAPYEVHYPEEVASAQLRAAAATLNSGDVDNEGVLDPGEKWTFVIDDQVPILEDEDIDALFTGETPAGTPVEAAITLAIDILPGRPSTRLDLSLTDELGILVRTTKPGAAPLNAPLAPGDYVLWITERNDSPDDWARFSDVVLTLTADPVPGLPTQLTAASPFFLGPDSGMDGILAPGEAWRWRIPFTVDGSFSIEVAGRAVDQFGQAHGYPGGPTFQADLDQHQILRVAVPTPGTALSIDAAPNAASRFTAALDPVDAGAVILLRVRERNVSGDAITAFSDVRVDLPELGRSLTIDSPSFRGGDDNGNRRLDDGETFEWILRVQIDRAQTLTAAAQGTDQLGRRHTSADDPRQRGQIQIRVVESISTALRVVPSGVPNGGLVHLRITETNDGAVPLTDTTVTLTANGGEFKDTFTGADPEFVTESDTNGDGRLDPGETWTWELDLALDATTDFEVTATNQSPEGLHTHLDDRDQRVALTVQIRPSLTIVLEAMGDTAPLPFPFFLDEEPFTLIAPVRDSKTTTPAPGRHVIVAWLPPDLSDRQWAFLALGCEPGSALFEMQTISDGERTGTRAVVDVTEQAITCTYTAKLGPAGVVPTPAPPRSGLDLRIATDPASFVDGPLQIDSGDRVHRGVILENRTNRNFDQVQVVLTVNGVDTSFDLDPLPAGATTAVVSLDEDEIDDDTQVDATAVGIDADGNEYSFNTDAAFVGVREGCCDALGGLWACFLLAVVGGVFVSTVVYSTRPYLPVGGRRPPTGGAQRPDGDGERQQEETPLLILNRNPAAREIHLADCRYAALIRQENRDEVWGSPEERRRRAGGDLPEGRIEALIVEGFDGCQYCLPSYHSR